MSLMLKLLLSTILLNSLVHADKLEDKVEDFLQDKISENPNIVDINVDVVDTIKISELKDWNAYIVKLDLTVKANKKGSDKKDTRKINQQTMWFSDGKVIARDLTLMSSGENLSDLVKPSFKDNFYKKENLIYGNANAKHKVAIFSDPLCPYCRKFVPKAINAMKKQPNNFAIYYFHFPLPSIHPAAIDLVKAATAAELKGHKDVVLNLYKVKVDAREKDVSKILKAFNKTMKTNIKESDLKSPQVMKHYKSDLKIAEDLMVGGTPTMFFDGELDKSKRKYEKAL